MTKKDFQYLIYKNKNYMKECNTCHEEKNISEFSKKNKLKDGTQRYQPICKKCFNIKDAERRKTKEYQENRKSYDKEFYSKNVDEILKYKKEHYNKNKDIILEKKKGYRENNKEKLNEYRINNLEKYAEGSRKYRQKHPHIVAWRNILYRTLRYLETDKEGDTESMLGYSAAKLKHHLEKQFVEGMSWDNHGEWHIDHIRPLISFPSNAEVSEVNALSNLQPLWMEENMAKFNHIIIPS